MMVYHSLEEFLNWLHGCEQRNDSKIQEFSTSTKENTNFQAFFRSSTKAAIETLAFTCSSELPEAKYSPFRENVTHVAGPYDNNTSQNIMIVFFVTFPFLWLLLCNICYSCNILVVSENFVIHHLIIAKPEH